MSMKKITRNSWGWSARRFLTISLLSGLLVGGVAACADDSTGPEDIGEVSGNIYIREARDAMIVRFAPEEGVAAIQIPGYEVSDIYGGKVVVYAPEGRLARDIPFKLHLRPGVDLRDVGVRVVSAASSDGEFDHAAYAEVRLSR